MPAIWFSRRALVEYMLFCSILPSIAGAHQHSSERVNVKYLIFSSSQLYIVLYYILQTNAAICFEDFFIRKVFKKTNGQGKCSTVVIAIFPHH